MQTRIATMPVRRLTPSRVDPFQAIVGRVPSSISEGTRTIRNGNSRCLRQPESD
jgi:hypothetical protein